MRIPTATGYLVPLQPHMAEEMFQLVHGSRRFLFPWMPWLAHIHSAQDVAAFIDKRLQENALHLVVCLEDGTLCGGVGFYQIDDHTKTATLGYWLGEDFVGQGLMLEALVAACHYAFTDGQLARLEIRCPVHNDSGRKVPERLGFSLDDIRPKAAWLGDQYVDHACYSLSKQAFLAGSLAKNHKVAAGQ